MIRLPTRHKWQTAERAPEPKRISLSNALLIDVDSARTYWTAELDTRAQVGAGAGVGAEAGAQLARAQLTASH